METKTSTFFSRLAARIPGYTGYVAKEERRETDRALRGAIATRLLSRTNVLDRQMADAARLMQLDALEPLEFTRRRLEALADRIRTAPAGYGGFFDAVTIGVAELEGIGRYDLALNDAVEVLVDELGALRAGDRPALDHLLSSVQAVEDAVRGRDRIVSGVDRA